MSVTFLEIAEQLEIAGLVWQPEIGDEVCERERRDNVSILVDPHGMTPVELRSIFLWLPTVEQLVFQFEARQAILFHAGLELGERVYHYKTVIQSRHGAIQSSADSLRESLGAALQQLLIKENGAMIQ